MNTNKLVNSILRNKSIVDLTGDKSIYFLHANNPKVPYVEYFFISERGGDWEESKEIQTESILQIDVFSNKNYTDLVDAIKKQFNRDSNCIRISEYDLWEEKTGLYHKVIRYKINSEKEN